MIKSNTLTPSLGLETWHQLLGKYVNSAGQVSYRAWQTTPADVAALNHWLENLQSIDITALDTGVSLALLINVYNALTVSQILTKYPIRSVRPSVMGVPNWPAFKLFFSKPIYQLGEQPLSLDNIEHDLLRARFGEPRIHFALVCASIGCPLLSNEAYWPEHIHTQLETAARTFINDPEKVRYDSDRKILYCSKIFQWYEQDFLAVSDSVPAYIQRYLSEPISLTAQVSHLPYNWQLNDVPT